jgi:MYXO-CTERM domain-containing protein
VSIQNNCEERLGPVRSLQIEAPHAVAWLVNRLNEHAEFWPVDCNPVSDELITDGTSPCFQLRTVNASGEHSQVTQYCPQLAENSRDGALPPKESSCSATQVGAEQSTTWPSALFALVALTAGRRRSRADT